MGSKEFKKYIPVCDLDIDNEHHLYLTSTDDEVELPISMKISQIQKEDEAERMIKQRSSNPKL
jgi:hypothetical protein